MPDEKIEALYSQAILTGLEATWDREESPGQSDGDRVFVRWIQRDPLDPGWDDWRLVAVIKPGGLDWSVEHGQVVRVFIADMITAGLHNGKVIDSANNLTVWWCRSKLDGPDRRVSDWAEPPGLPGRQAGPNDS